MTMILVSSATSAILSSCFLNSIGFFFKCLPRDRDPDYIITAVLEAMKVRDKSVVVSRSCKIATVASREDLVSIVKTSQVCNVGFILLRICVCRNSFGLYNYRAAGRQ